MTQEKLMISERELRHLQSLCVPTKWIFWGLYAHEAEEKNPLRAFIVNKDATAIKFLDNGEIVYFGRSIAYLDQKRSQLNLLPNKKMLCVTYELGLAYLLEAPITGAGVCEGNNRSLNYDFPREKFEYVDEEGLEEFYRLSVDLKRKNQNPLVAEVVAYQKRANNLLNGVKEENFSHIFNF